ncbi:MAG: FkbM family methyltransferase [Sulfitobacter sp.]|nr:FkbM family methyltransferase [Sulfitobacter sp.]
MKPFADPVPADPTLEALREAFRSADRATRRRLVPALPPAEVEFAGIRMYVDPRDNYTDRMIWLDSQPPEMTSLMALTEIVEGQNAFILDIGANCGAFTVPLALAAGEGSRVIAFEPNPVMIGRLGYNLSLNGLGSKVRIESCALGAEAGEAMLNLRTGNYGQATLNPIKERARAGGTLVPVRPLTEFTAQARDHDISVLKIDVEGAEVAVMYPLLEAGGWLPDVVLMETRHAGDWDMDLVKMMADSGFEPRLEADGNTLFVHKDAAH